MELHLHLSVAFRALDRKWGPATDLDTSEGGLPCLPAVIDRLNTTFSSEEFLRKTRRPTPYSRFEERRRRNKNVKSDDSFADISSSRIPSLSELEAVSMDSGLDEDCRTVTGIVEDLSTVEGFGSTASLDSGLEEKKPVYRILHQLKSSAQSFLNKRRRKIAKF